MMFKKSPMGGFFYDGGCFKTVLSMKSNISVQKVVWSFVKTR